MRLRCDVECFCSSAIVQVIEALATIEEHQSNISCQTRGILSRLLDSYIHYVRHQYDPRNCQREEDPGSEMCRARTR